MYVRPGYRARVNAGHTKILEQVTLLSQQKHNLKLIFPGWYAGRLREVPAKSRTSNMDRVVSSCRNELRGGHVTWIIYHRAAVVLASAWHGDYNIFGQNRARGERRRPLRVQTSVFMRAVDYRQVPPYAEFFHCDSHVVDHQRVRSYIRFFHCNSHAADHRRLIIRLCTGFFSLQLLQI